ncbi:hypothetical protein M0R45_005262 [Rubus argutus]|uniref:MHC class I antigen n=1 Tax=Rubus argutus TaxID=59490 RepID=A0AAW1YM42_RUBAR
MKRCSSSLTLSDYIEKLRKSQDFEVVSGPSGHGGVCGYDYDGGGDWELVVRESGQGRDCGGGWGLLGAVTCAVVAAWMSSARTRVGSDLYSGL